jgi:hypothetical protein
MPYAFVAGVIFMSVNLAFESMWPSVILHFLNNAMSVIWIKYCVSDKSALIFISLLMALALISSAFLILGRERYKSYASRAFDKGVAEFDSNSAVALIVISLYIAISALFV